MFSAVLFKDALKDIFLPQYVWKYFRFQGSLSRS